MPASSAKKPPARAVQSLAKAHAENDKALTVSDESLRRNIAIHVPRSSGPITVLAVLTVIEIPNRAPNATLHTFLPGASLSLLLILAL